MHDSETNFVTNPEWRTLKNNDKEMTIKPFRDFNIKDDYFLGIGENENIYYTNNISEKLDSVVWSQIGNSEGKNVTDIDFNIMNK